MFWLRPSALLCDALRWRCYRTFCLWVVLWCGHAVLPFPSFGLVFLFHLVCSLAALALARSFLVSCPSHVLGVYASVSFCSPSSSCPVLVLFRVGLHFLVHVHLLFRGSLVWYWVSVTFFSLCGLLGRVSLLSSSLLGLRFLSPVPPWCCSPLVALAHVHFCLWVHGFLDPLSLLRLFTLTCSSTLALRTFPRILVSFLGCLVIFLLGCFFLSSLSFGIVWFLFTFFITRSNLSSFATGSSLWTELSRMVVSWGSSGLSHLRSLVVRPLPVLVDGSLILLIMLLGWRSFLSFGSLLWGSSPALSSWGFPPSRMDWLSFL